MSVISLDNTSTVIRDQASPKITHPHSTLKRRSQYTLKIKEKKTPRIVARSHKSAVEMPLL